MTFPKNNIKGIASPEQRENMEIRDTQLVARFVVGQEREASLARDYGLTRERVRQIITKSLGKRAKKRIQGRNRKVRHLQKLLKGKPAVSALHLRHVDSVVAAQPVSPSVGGVSNQRERVPTSRN